MSEKDIFVRHLRQIQPKFSRFYAHLLTDADLTLPQYALLSELASAGIISMTEASEKLHITKPAVTNLVDRLEKKQFLKRLSHPRDRRVFLLEIQPKGERWVRKTQARVLRLILKAIHPFSSHERKIIDRFYALLSQTLDHVLRSRGKGR